MRRTTVAIIIALIAAPALAQPAPPPPPVIYDLKGMTGQEISTIGKALQQLPYGEVTGLMNKIVEQVNDQNKVINEREQAKLAEQKREAEHKEAAPTAAPAPAAPAKKE